METMNNVLVDEVQSRGIGKGSGIVVMGLKYGCYDPAKHNLDAINAGDVVTFAYKDTGKYKNVQGTINKVSAGTGAPTTAPAKPFVPKGRSFGAFPIDPLDGQRSIIRQNSVTNAVNLMKAFPISGELSSDELAQDVISLARKFEAYSSGDLDKEEVDQAMKDLEALSMQ